MKVSVKVPASSANIGPGFDCLGMALPIYNTITIEETVLPGTGIEINLMSEEEVIDEMVFDNIPKDENEIKTEFSTKPVSISKVSQTSIDWDAISTNIRTIINKGFEIYDFLDKNKVFEIANDTQTFAESEENKDRSIIGNRMKLLGMYQTLKLGWNPKRASDFSRNMRWRDIRELMRGYGIWEDRDTDPV